MPAPESTDPDLLQRELRESQERIRLQTAALEAAANGMAIVGRDGFIRWINRAFSKLTGYEKSELIGKNPRILKSGAHPDEFYRELWRTIIEGRAWKGELVNRHKSGRLYHEEMTITPVADSDGAIAHFIAIKQDITARKLAEDALHRQQTELRVLFDLVPAMIWFKDTKNGFLRVNQRVAEATGLKIEQIEGKSAHDLFPKQADAYYEDDLEVIRSRRPKLGIVEKLRGPEGRDLWVQTDKVPVLSPDGAVVGLVALVHDITERRLMETALRESEKRFAGAFEYAPIGIALVAPDGRWIKVNRAICALVGYTEQELLARTFQDITHAEDLATDLAHVRRMLDGEIDTYQIEKRYIHAQGHFVNVLLTVSLVRHHDGRPDYFIAQIQDITARKQAEAELVAVYKQLVETSRQAGMAEVATNVLHNVGNVLNSVTVSASLVADIVRRSKIPNVAKLRDLVHQHRADLARFLAEDPKGSMIPDYLAILADSLAAEQRTVVAELDDLQKNIGHIKDIVAMQQSYAKTSGVMEAVPVPDLFEDALRMNAGSLARLDIEVVRDYGAHPVVTVEKNKVLQILVNLIRNARYACDESDRADKRITLRIRDEPSGVSIAVIDNGVGISAENLTRVFAHGFTTRKQGHGFGLHSGALAARELGGSLTAHSDGPGKGATFTLTLPLSPASDPS